MSNNEKHSKIGASSCHRWWNCPGSVALCADMPPQEPNIYASEGTLAHSMAEEWLKKHFDDPEWQDWIGDVKEVNGFEIEVTEEMYDAVKVYVIDYVNEALRCSAKPFKIYGTDEKWIHIEKKFHLREIDEDCYGTNDLTIDMPLDRMFRTADYKHGAGIAVEVKDNKQLMIYALEFLSDKYRSMSGDLHDLFLLTTQEYDKVELVIIQPRADHPDGPIRKHVILIKQLFKFAYLLEERVQETKQSNAKLCAGDWCRWCTAKPVCPELSKEVDLVIQDDFSAKDPLVSIKKLPVDLLEKRLEKIPLIREVCKAMEDYALRLAEGGTKFKDHKLVARRATRTWKDKVSAGQKFGGNLGRQAYKTELLSPAQALGLQ